MRRLHALIHRLRDLVRGDRLETEMDAELAFHLEREVDENLRRGLSPEEARAAAHRSLGMAERIKEECRRQHGFVRLEILWSDLKLTVRGLRRSPGFTAATVVTLALGIGATTALFSVVRSVLLRPLPFPEPDRLVQLLGYDREAGLDRGTLSYPNFDDVRRTATSFSSMAIFDEWDVLVAWQDGAEKLSGATVSASFFETLGVAPALGRFFLPAEDVPGAARSVVLSNGLWRRRFGADPEVVGTTLDLNGYPYEVVGVAPADLEDPGLATAGTPPVELWRSPRTYFATGSSRDGRAFTAVARLRPGVSLERARRELTTLLRRLERAHPEDNAGRTWTAVPVEERILGGVAHPLWLLFAAAGLVLLVACANVAGLLVVRAEHRIGEVAVRAMVGASRGRLLRQLAVESLLLAALGAGVGAAAGLAAVRALGRVGGDQIPRWAGAHLDASVLAFAVAVALVTALLFGLAPALRLARTDLNAVIDDTRRGATAGAPRSHARRALIATQVAVALVLLVASALVGRSLGRLQGVPTGLATEELLSARLTTPAGRYDEPPAALALYDRLLERASALPGARSAAAVNILPMSGSFDGRQITLEDRPEPAPGQEPSAEARTVSPGFFRTAGIPLIEGRGIQATDGPSAAPVAVVDEAMAERYWPGRSPVGRRLTLSSVTREIVGVVGSVRQFGLDRPVEPTFYLPMAQTPRWMWSDSALLVRTDGSPEDLAAGLRHAVGEVDAGIAVTHLTPMETVVSRTYAGARFRTFLLGAFAGLALLLGAIGLYGVVAYATAGRSRELGIRMALGADRRRIRSLVAREGLVPAAAGAVVGLAAAMALSRALEGLLFGIEPADPVALVGAAATLLAAALVACLLPARRATRIDPVETLKA